jgi:hypothetical protein
MTTNKTSPRYVINTVIQLGLWNIADYKQAREAKPDLIPSEYMVRKHFGDFEKLFEIAQRESLKISFDKIVKMRDKTGRWPSMKELQVNNIDMSRLYKIFEGKRNFDKFLDKYARTFLTRVL